MTKKEITDLAQKQQALIAETQVYFEELKYFFGSDLTELEKEVLRYKPFTTIQISFERTLLLIYSYLISDRKKDFHRLIKTLNGLQNKKKQLKDWDINIDPDTLESQISLLNELRTNTKVMDIRDTMVAHLDNTNPLSIDIEYLEKLHKYFEEVSNTTLSEVTKTNVISSNIPNIKTHMKKHRELSEIENKYWKLIER